MPKKTKYGSRGEYSGNASEHLLYFRWINMLRRCYEPSFHGYESYGGKGVTVEPYLQVFANYEKHISSLPNYDKLIEDPSNWQIDKDENGGNIYSRETIQIVPSSKNLEIENAKKRVSVFRVLDNGEKEVFESISEAEKKTGIWKGNIARSIKRGYLAGGYRWGNAS